MSVLRSKSASHLDSLDARRSTGPDARPRPKLPRHRSAVTVSASSHFVSLYAPRDEREDAFSLSGFFPSNLSPSALEPATQQESEWWRTSDEDDVPIEYLSGRVSPISEGDEEWDVPTPRSPDAEDAHAVDAIRQEDKLGILALGDTLFLPSRGGEPYVEDRLFSPYSQPGDPLDADAVHDALRALRTAHSLPPRSAAKDDLATLHELFSPDGEAEDKATGEEEGWGALVSWGVSRVVDYISPV